jgi:hypothetical protein
MCSKTCAGLLTATVVLAIGCSQSPVAPSQAPAATPTAAAAASGGGSATSAGTAAASAPTRHDVPFSGDVTGEANFATNPKGCAAGFTTITDAKGQALHMGLTSWHSEHCVVNGSSIEGGELVLTAANGDQVHVAYSGSCALDGMTVNCTGPAVISGGTGRFEHASGTAQWSGAIAFEGFDDVSWAGRWWWKGTIVY